MRWLLFLLFLGCRGETAELCGDPCSLQDDQNFSYESELEVAESARSPGTDVVLDWSDLSLGLQNNALCPDEDIDDVVLVVFSSLSPADVRAGLATDSLQQADVSVYMLCEPEEGQARCALSNFGLLGSYPGMDEYFVEDSGTWLVALQSDRLVGAQALVFLDPVEGAGTETVTIDDQSTGVSVQVDLVDLPPVGLPEGDQGVLDWSELTRDGYGNPMALHTLSELQIGRYDETLEEISDHFVELDSLAEETWLVDIEGRTEVSLAELEGDRSFPGLDRDSRWLLALRCGSCDSPVPRVLMVLEPVRSP